MNDEPTERSRLLEGVALMASEIAELKSRLRAWPGRRKAKTCQCRHCYNYTECLRTLGESE